MRSDVQPGLLAQVATLLRRLAGMPDYEAYLEHCRTRHPDRPVESEAEFYRQYLRARYADGPTRCC